MVLARLETVAETLTTDHQAMCDRAAAGQALGAANLTEVRTRLRRRAEWPPENAFEAELFLGTVAFVEGDLETCRIMWRMLNTALRVATVRVCTNM